MRRHPILTIFKFLVKAALVIFGTNMIFAFIEQRVHKDEVVGGHYFNWKHGRIFYHKRGSGNPVILLHGVEPSDSGRDLMTLSKALSTHHTVYTIDLLGFGLSDKPWITYTNFIYVLMIQDFIKNVTKDVTDIIACEGSALFALQAHRFDSSNIGKVIAINPAREEAVKNTPVVGINLKHLLCLPFIGTFIYNMYSLAGQPPYNKDSRYVYANRVSGHLTTSITGRDDLIDEDIKIFDDSEESFTFGDISFELI